MKGTKLEEMYLQKSYTPPTLEEYSTCTALCLGYISEKMTVHRLTGDCPRDMLVAPLWNKDKNAILDAIKKEMTKKNIKQGSLL
jgi:radical SAM superfamily enzyme